jgi:hypothetical protein
MIVPLSHQHILFGYLVVLLPCFHAYQWQTATSYQTQLQYSILLPRKRPSAGFHGAIRSKNKPFVPRFELSQASATNRRGRFLFPLPPYHVCHSSPQTQAKTLYRGGDQGNPAAKGNGNQPQLGAYAIWALHTYLCGPWHMPPERGPSGSLPIGKGVKRVITPPSGHCQVR